MENRGQLFLIVGNSGSGKDALIQEVLNMWPKDKKPFHIPQRYITRSPHRTEPFISVTPEEFKKLNEEGKFCLTWHTYDLDYGIPAEIVNWLNKGEHTMVNVSREVIPEVRKKIPEAKVIYVNVPVEVSVKRIKGRGREFENDPVFRERVKRAFQHKDLPHADFVIDNSGPLKMGAEKLCQYLQQFG